MEAGFHPFVQRKIADIINYTSWRDKKQFIITTHSPQIACEFSPNSMIKLYRKTANESFAASNGCSNVVSEAFEKLNYRLNILPAEAFFANVVFL